jgi:hypothetical protein
VLSNLVCPSSVERAVHQPERQLPEDDGYGDAEDFGHGVAWAVGRVVSGEQLRPGADAGAVAHGYFGASGHRPAMGPKDCGVLTCMTRCRHGGLRELGSRRQSIGSYDARSSARNRPWLLCRPAAAKCCRY